MDHSQMQPLQQPPDYGMQEGAQVKGGHYQDHQHYHPYEPYTDNGDPLPPPTGPTIISITRGLALCVLGVTVFLLATVIRLSAGLGVSQRNLQQAKGDLGAAQAALSSAVAAGAATTVLSATTTAAASPSATPAAADVQCPAVNGTLYTASSGGKRFRRMCGIDYGGEGEAVDIGNVKTRSLDACIDACASQGNCTGAGWGIIKGDQGPTHSCWMKANLTKSHKATPDWGFAVFVGS